MIPSSGFVPSDLFRDEELYMRRVELLSRLRDPAKFARNAYVVTTLGYIVSTPFGFSDSTSPLPSQEQEAAELLCGRRTSSQQIIPYLYYLPYREKGTLCNCLEGEITRQLLSDPFTHNVIVSYLVDHVCRSEGFPPGYRLLKTAYFCSGTGNLWEEDVSPLPATMDPILLSDMIGQVCRTVKFLALRIAYVAPLLISQVAYRPPYFKIGGFTDAEVVCDTDKGLLLLRRENKPLADIYLDDFPYFYYSPTHRMPWSSTLYSFFVSLLALPRMRAVFFSQPWSVSIWEGLFPTEGDKVRDRLERVSGEIGREGVAVILKGVRIPCTPGIDFSPPP